MKKNYAFLIFAFFLSTESAFSSVSDFQKIESGSSAVEAQKIESIIIKIASRQLGCESNRDAVNFSLSNLPDLGLVQTEITMAIEDRFKFQFSEDDAATLQSPTANIEKFVEITLTYWK